MERRYYHVTLSEFQRLWESGTHVADIAKHFGVSRHFVYAARNDFGLPARGAVRLDNVPDPTPEEIRLRKRECRRKHFAQRRAEPLA